MGACFVKIGACKSAEKGTVRWGVVQAAGLQAVRATWGGLCAKREMLCGAVFGVDGCVARSPYPRLILQGWPAQAIQLAQQQSTPAKGQTYQALRHLLPVLVQH